MLLIPAETGGSFVSSRLAGTTDSVSGKKGKCQGLERIYPGAKLRSLVSKLIVIGAGELAQWFRADNSFAEDLSTIPGTYVQ